MRRRARLEVALVALLTDEACSCSYVLPWTADWKKPGASEEDRSEAVAWCRGSATTTSPTNAGTSIAERQTPSPASSRSLDTRYTFTFSDCMARLGWER